MTAYLVRHANAGDRAEWKGPDRLRPLTTLGQRQAEELASRIKASQDIEKAIQQVTVPPKRTPELTELETHFRDALMVKVDLKCNPKGKGTLVLHFNSQDELENLYSKLVKRET